MVLRDPVFRAPDPEDLKGSIWAQLAGAEPPLDAVETSIVDIVSPQQSSVDAATGFETEIAGEFRVHALMVDFAQDMDGEVWIDGQLRFQTRDGLGLGGQFKLGDTSGNAFMRIRSVKVVCFNQHATNSRDVRAWMVVT